jgi:hypothetical protein
MSFVGPGMGADEKSNSLTMGLTDKEIDERVRFSFSCCLDAMLNTRCLTRRLRKP